MLSLGRPVDPRAGPVGGDAPSAARRATPPPASREREEEQMASSETTGTVPEPPEVQERLEAALFEIRRVIAGQDAMLERVLVCLLAGGHLLIEGVPGLAKTLTIKTTASVLGGTFHRIQFTPDLVPSDLVGTRVYRPDTGVFETELGPVFCNFLLADEINRAPAKVQSALLEVMQEHQVTIGHTSYPVPDPFLVMATQNPIESEGTYPLPEAQVDRFMLKILVDYPLRDEELVIVQRQLVPPPDLRQELSLEDLRLLQRAVLDVYVDPAVVSYAVSLAEATRAPAAHGLPQLAPYVEFGASPRGPISIVQSARALALLRGRDYVLAQDLEALARDAFRHRLVLSYQALAEEVGPDRILDDVLAAVPQPQIDLGRASAA
jgi:MoxR-like ATPase